VRSYFDAITNERHSRSIGTNCLVETCHWRPLGLNVEFDANYDLSVDNHDQRASLIDSLLHFSDNEHY
jgi:hypothetical protein